MTGRVAAEDDEKGRMTARIRSSQRADEGDQGLPRRDGLLRIVSGCRVGRARTRIVRPSSSRLAARGISDGEGDAAHLEDLEAAQERVVYAHHRAGIVELACAGQRGRRLGRRTAVVLRRVSVWRDGCCDAPAPRRGSRAAVSRRTRLRTSDGSAKV